MGTRIVQVDAFADRPFTGNPAGVCLLVDQPEDRWMQAVAGEMNLAETAFLRRLADGFALRWFTPTVEVDLCGHVTLASAHHLWESGELALEKTARFHTRSGLLTACRRDDWIEMNFPADPPELMEPPRGLVEALGAAPIWCGKGRFDWLVRLASEADVRELVPDLGEVERLTDRGLIVTAESAGGEADFVSRFFAPAVGVSEDPVTGSAHCCLAPYWSERLGQTALTGYQASQRGGWVRVEALGERVLLAGRAVTVMDIELRPDAGEHQRSS